MPARGVRSARWRFHTERGSIFSFPLLGKGCLGRRAASGWQPAQGQLPIRQGSSRTSGEARGVAGPGVGEVAGPRQEGGSALQPPMRAGIGAGTRRGAALLRGGTPVSRPLRSSPTPGARGGFREARPGPWPSSF